MLQKKKAAAAKFLGAKKKEIKKLRLLPKNL